MEKGRVILATQALQKAIAGKKIALMMSCNALDETGRILLDVITDQWRADVRFFFGMEHGVRGNFTAGDSGIDTTDKKTGLPVVNLYDYFELRPPVEWVEKVDAVVFCAQDAGVRHWTFTPWMMTLIEAAAQANREVIILDLPNPIRGDIVEGAGVDEKFVGIEMLSGFSYPLRHGMTIGELALMFNETKQLGCKLTVLPMEGWRRDMWHDQTGLIWVPASPNMPHNFTPLYFATTGLFQAANVSCGVGTTTPFQYLGAPWVDGEAFANAINDLAIPGLLAVQKYYPARICETPGLPLCDGAFLVCRDREQYRPVTAQLQLMDILAKMYPGQFDLEKHYLSRPRMGTDAICDRLQSGQSIADLIPQWAQSAEAFAVARKPYLLYE